MTLGERLKGYVGERKQAALAAEWLARWTERKERKGKAWTLDTITSSFSRCFNDQPEGVRFFFGERARAVLLFDVLEVPAKARDELLALADAAMRTGTARPAQIIIDLTEWSGDRDKCDALFLAVEKQILEPYRKLVPVVLLMTEDQYRYLPRTFDDFGDDVRTERIKDSERTRERVLVLAEDQGLVLTPYPFPVFERWVATKYYKRELSFEPPDALLVFAERGELTRLPEIAHDLAALGAIEIANKDLPGDPQALRRLMADLCDEKCVTAMNESAGVRLGWANKLGITATSTERERVEAEIAALAARIKMGVNAGDAEKLEALLARAKRRPVEATAMRVGDAIHVLNPKTIASDVENHARVTVHRIDVPTPALVRLLDELDTWTKYDAADDPLLEHVIERLDPNGDERLAMLHARAQILHSRTMRMRDAEPEDDWKTPLQALLAEPLPEASLRLSVIDKQDRYDSGGENLVVCPPMHDIAKALQSRGVSLCLRPVNEIIAERGTPLLACWRQNDDRRDPPPILLEEDEKRARDPNRWLDLLEVSPACGGIATKFEELQRNHLWGWGQSPIHRWREERLPITKRAWHEADCQLALVWLSLRRAFSNESVRLGDGTVLLPLGAGIVAEISVLRYPPRVPRDGIRASLEMTIHYENLSRDRSERRYAWVEQSFTAPVVSHRADTASHYKASTEIGPHLPPSIRVEGHGVVTEITFRYSPLFVGSNHGVAPSIAAASAAAFATGTAFDDAERKRLS